MFASSAHSEAAPTLRALLIIDTNARNAEGLGIVVDGYNMVKVLSQATAALGEDAVDVVLLINNDVSERRILSTISAMRVNKEDTLFVYYSGHGGAIEKLALSGEPAIRKRSHFLAMSSGYMMRSTLRGAMEKKGAKLNILLTDACANYPSLAAASKAQEKGDGFRGDFRKRAEQADVRTPVVNVSVLKHVMFHDYGWADISAASLGDTAIGRGDGGVFTNAFLNMLATRDITKFGFGETDITNVRWESIFSSTMDKMQRATGAIEAIQGIVVLPDGVKSPEYFDLPLPFSSELPLLEGE